MGSCASSLQVMYHLNVLFQMSSRRNHNWQILTKCQHRHFLSCLSLHRTSLTTFVLISRSPSDQWSSVEYRRLSVTLDSDQLWKQHLHKLPTFPENFHPSINRSQTQDVILTIYCIILCAFKLEQDADHRPDRLLGTLKRIECSA